MPDKPKIDSFPDAPVPAKPAFVKEVEHKPTGSQEKLACGCGGHVWELEPDPLRSMVVCPACGNTTLVKKSNAGVGWPPHLETK